MSWYEFEFGTLHLLLLKEKIKIKNNTCIHYETKRGSNSNKVRLSH